VFRSADAQTGAELAHEVRNALLRWEARVDVDSVNVVPDGADRTMLYIDIQYRIKETNDRRNLVFPFYTIPEDGSDY
jgi:phage baseplate assembly protein W